MWTAGIAPTVVALTYAALSRDPAPDDTALTPGDDERTVAEPQ